MKKSFWQDDEVKDLFNVVEDVKDSNKPLKDAFIFHAQKYSRKPNSVRNYYYYQLMQLKNDALKTQRLGIDLSRHEKVEVEYFSKQDQDKLVLQINNLIKKGMSIRKACLVLSGGDLNLMLRYQNKYRNICAKEKSKNLPDNIIKFSKKKNILTDSDINSLFIGLVRLVKRNAIEEYTAKNFNQLSSNAKLRKMLVDLNKKDREIEKLKEEFARIKKENALLVEKMMKLKIEKAEKLTIKKA